MSDSQVQTWENTYTWALNIAHQIKRLKPFVYKGSDGNWYIKYRPKRETAS